jgi:hypothetical protein
MIRIVFKHLSKTQNIGDRSCSPYAHIADLSSEITPLDLYDPTPPCDAVVYGGGKIFGSLHASLNANDRQAARRIAWGVSTVQTNPLSLRYFLSRKSMHLIGSRDFGDTRYDYAPCVSCMSPIFDEPFKIEHDVVFYAHHEKTQQMHLHVPSHIPTMDNHAASMEEAVRFIGSGHTVVSNSYHGIYWALLLGRHVLCVPFSNKFHHYRLSPGYARASDWVKSLKMARRHDEMLGLSRQATAKFQLKVQETLSSIA